MVLAWIKNAIKRRSLTHSGRQYWRRKEYEKAIECYEAVLCLDLSFKRKDHRHVAEDYDNIGIGYRGLGDYDRAIEYYLKAIDILERVSPDHILLPSPYNHIGIAYRYKGNYKLAAEYHEKALRIQRMWAGPFVSTVTRTTATLLAAARTELERHGHNRD